MSRIYSSLNLTPLYTFVSKKVIAVSDTSAVNFIVQSNLSYTDTEGTEQSVHIREVSVV